jgi:hypothetical protein
LLAIPAVALLGLTAYGGDGEPPGAAESAENLALLANIPQQGIFLGERDAPVTLLFSVKRGWFNPFGALG